MNLLSSLYSCACSIYEFTAPASEKINKKFRLASTFLGTSRAETNRKMFSFARNGCSRGRNGKFCLFTSAGIVVANFYYIINESGTTGMKSAGSTENLLFHNLPTVNHVSSSFPAFEANIEDEKAFSLCEQFPRATTQIPFLNFFIAFGSVGSWEVVPRSLSCW